MLFFLFYSLEVKLFRKECYSKLETVFSRAGKKDILFSLEIILLAFGEVQLSTPKWAHLFSRYLLENIKSCS